MTNPESKRVTIAEALRMANEKGIGVTRATMIRWTDEHGIRIQPGGPGTKSFVDRAKLEGILNEPTD